MFVFAPLLAFAALVAAQSNLSIDTPASVVQCHPVKISFTASFKPVSIKIISASQVGAAPLKDLGSHSTSPFTWKANIKEGTSITFQIQDSAGALAFSPPVTVQGSEDCSCLE